MKNFKGGDISVIVQGAIDKKETPKCLKSIRKYLPDAEIILSTWEGSDISIIDGLYDILVLNKDPGAEIFDYTFNKFNNVNRQLVSTQNGLKQATRKYSLKFRTDFYLTGSDFLDYFDCFSDRDKEFSIFKHRVIVSQTFTRSHFDGTPTPFHISDFYMFGLTEDIKKYFLKTPLVSKENIANCKLLYPDKNPNKNTQWNYPPEQYYCIEWVKRFFKNVKFEDWSDWNDENIKLSNNIIFNNFIILGHKEEDIFSKKHKWGLTESNKLSGIITYELFCNKYKERNSNFSLPQKLKIREKLKKHEVNVVKPINLVKNWICEVIAFFYYTIIYILERKKDENRRMDK